jgi:hypothetical protein
LNDGGVKILRRRSVALLDVIDDFHHVGGRLVSPPNCLHGLCGIFAHGFARARCDDCGHDFLVAFSCKGRGVCPFCNTRRMAERAAHLTGHVFPRLPVRQ